MHLEAGPKSVVGGKQTLNYLMSGFPKSFRTPVFCDSWVHPKSSQKLIFVFFYGLSTSE